MSELYFEPALFEDYYRWAKAYTLKGGKFTQFIDAPWTNNKGRFAVARRDFTLSGGYGTNRIDVIIPEGIRFMGGDIGHCNLYDMNTSNIIPDGHFTATVPLFNEPELLALRGAAKFAEVQRIRQAEIRAQRAEEEREYAQEREDFLKYNPIGQYYAALKRLSK